MKSPEVGDWYEGICRYFVVGKNTKGQFACECENGCIVIVSEKTFASALKHLPGCDSWTWQPETFPQYWTTYNPEEFLYVVRDTKDDLVSIRKNGTKLHGRWSEGDAHRRTQLTKEQAEALLTPVESPDDWVTQDIVPARRWIDQEYWISGSNSIDWRDLSPNGPAAADKMIHGKKDQFGDTLLLRCRRSDLPKIEPKTRTVTLTPFICWDREGEEQARWHVEPPKGWLHVFATPETKTVEVQK